MSEVLPYGGPKGGAASLCLLGHRVIRPEHPNHSILHNSTVTAPELIDHLSSQVDTSSKVDTPSQVGTRSSSLLPRVDTSSEVDASSRGDDTSSSLLPSEYGWLSGMKPGADFWGAVDFGGSVDFGGDVDF